LTAEIKSVYGDKSLYEMSTNKPLSKESEDDLLSQTSVNADSKLSFSVTKKDMKNYVRPKDNKLQKTKRQL